MHFQGLVRYRTKGQGNSIAQIGLCGGYFMTKTVRTVTEITLLRAKRRNP